MMNESTTTLYETLFILRPEHAAKVKEFLERSKNIIETRHGIVTHIEEWGNRELAYPINKQSRGNYTLMRYRGSAGTVEELERTMKLSEEIMRCLTVRLDEGDDVPSPHAPREIPPAPSTSENTESSEQEGSAQGRASDAQSRKS